MSDNLCGLNWLLFASVVGALHGCGQKSLCNCAVFPVEATLVLPCGTESIPTLTISGPCVVSPGGRTPPGAVDFVAKTAGTCQIGFTTDGATYAVTLDFATEYLPCGSDPQGCGPFIGPTVATMSVGPQCADAGMRTDAS